MDSSRYFVLRIADRESNNHAFIGLGFRWASASQIQVLPQLSGLHPAMPTFHSHRERAESSNFTAALDDYRLYIKRCGHDDEIILLWIRYNT